MIDYVTDHSLLDAKELTYDFIWNKKKSVLTCGAVAMPVRWQDRFKKIFRKIDIPLVHFVPESYAIASLLPEKPTGDFSILMFNYGLVTVSVFHNGLLYDTFLMSPGINPDQLNCDLCLDELKKMAVNFYSEFEKDIHQFYFINFPDELSSKIKDSFSKKSFSATFINKESYHFPDIFETSSDLTILAGLAKKILEKS